MKKAILLPCILIFSLTATAQQHWLNKGGGAGNDEAQDMVRDANGDLYLTGYFSFGAAFGTINLVGEGDTDVFVAKVSGTTGQYLWVKRFGGPNADGGIAIAMVPGGGVAVTGFFNGHATFGTQQVNAMAASEDIFVLRLDANGDVVWVRTGGGPGSDIPYDVACDPTGNIVATGAFKGAATFSGQAMVSITDPIAMEPSYDIYILKYAPTGTLSWGLQGAAEYEDRGMAIATDQQGDIYVAGQFSDTITFNQTYLNGMFNAGFLLKLAPDGTEQWMTRFGATMCLPRSMVVDNLDRVYLTGDFLGNMAIFGPQTVTASNPFQRKVFLARFNGLGGADWISTLGSDNQLTSQKVALDVDGTPYIMGDFKCSFTELAAPNAEGVFYSVGFRDVFAAKFNLLGERQWVHHLGGPRDDRAGGLAMREVDRPIMAGGFQATFNVPYVPSAFQFNPETNVVYQHINPDYLNYCSDANYARFVSVLSSGQRDVFITEPFNPSRQTYDYFQRNGSQCDRPYLISEINPAVPVVTTCDSVLIKVNTHTDRKQRIGPIHTYNWSNGMVVDSFWVDTSAVLTVEIARLDGCRAFQDTIAVIVLPPTVPPLVTDDHNVNIASPDADKIFACHPGTVTVWGVGMQPGHTYGWMTPFGIVYSDTITVTTTTTIQRFAAMDSGCLEMNAVPIIIDDFANDEPIDPHIVIHEYEGPMVIGDTMHACRLDTFLIQVFDSLLLSGNGYLMPYMDYSISYAPTELISPVPLMWGVNDWHFTVQQSGWITFNIIVTDYCNPDYPTYNLSRSIYINMFNWTNNPVISGPIDICPGDTVQLSVSGGQGYLWTGPGVVAPTNNSTVLVTQGGLYTVWSEVLTDEGCLSVRSDTLTIPDRAAPQIAMVPFNGIICPYDSVLMTMPPGSGYQWIGPNGDVIGTGQTAFGEVAGPYFCLMTDPTGCSLVSDIIELAEFSSPYIVAEPSLTMCEGQTITLEVFTNEGSLVQWAAPLSGTGPYQTVSDTGTYSVSATLCGFTETVSVTITPFSIPIQAMVIGPDTVCFGETIMLTATPGYPFMEWSEGTQSQYLQVTESGTYSVSIADDSGCEAVSNTVSVYVRPALPVPAGLDTTVCSGDTVILPLVPYSGLDYLWSVNAIAPQWSPAPDTLVIGPITANSGGALAFADSLCISDPSLVYINPIAASGPPQVAGSASLCIGDTLLLTIADTGNAIITWNLPSGTSVQGSTLFLPVPLAGDYTLSIDPLLCPVVDSAFAVVVNVPIEMTVTTSALYFCATDSITLSVDSVTLAVWHPMEIAGLSIPITGEGEQQIYATALDTNGCSVTSAVVTVTGYAPPATPAISDTSFCQWTDVQLSIAQDNVNHQWQEIGDSTVQIDSLLIPSIATEAWVSVTPFDSLCIGLPDTFLVAVVPFPSLDSISDAMAVCYHDPLTLGVMGVNGVAVQWTLPDATTVQGDSLLLAVPMDGDYVLAAANGACSVSDTFTVTVIPQLPVAIDPESPLYLCAGETVEVNAPEGFEDYVWLPDSTIGTAFTVPAPGNYLLHATDTAGCVHPSDTLLALAVAAPAIPAGLSDTTICQGTGMIFSTGNTALDHHWQVNGTNSSATYVLQLAVILEETVVALSVTDTLTGCTSDTMEITVEVIVLPAAPQTTITSPLCEGEEAMLTATVYPDVDYLWTGPMGEVGTTPDLGFGPMTMEDAGTYVLTYSIQHCSEDADPVTLVVNPIPHEPEIEGNGIICEGDTLRLTLQHPDNVEFLWTAPLPGNSSESIIAVPDMQVSMGGQYGATATLEGCVSDTAWLHVTVSAPPQLELGPDTVICMDTPVLFHLDELTFSEVLWSTGETSYSISIDLPDTLHVTAWTDGGCVLSDTVAVESIDCDPVEATVFTPDGDGVNDHFTLFRKGVVEQQIVIYNRWGHKVYVLQSIDDSWDGTHHVTKADEPEGTYYYVGEVKLMSGRTAIKKNYLQLLR
jgi:gliding motility-associated-like protein